MRKIGFIKCNDTTKEILPKTYKVNQIEKRRKMFCTLINQYLSKHSQFDLNKTDQFNYSLLEIFEQRIVGLFQFHRWRPESPQKVLKIYHKESLLFQQYFKQSKVHKMRYLSRGSLFDSEFQLLVGYEHPAAELIQLIFNGKEISMMLDLDALFTQTVYQRIKREKDKKVTLDAPYIHIDQKGVRTSIYPRWKKVDKSSMNLRKDDIEEGFEQLQNKEVDQCYLVYPKTDNFQKHITVMNQSKEKEIKMIPYSFTFCTRERKRCKK
ncbi:hypothetical protein [Sulfurimonas sp.]|uniref:hypothetical protein n=1 Tax=Sulfurimonas sp. TaxID=2022749 RepID=UPI003D0E1E91